MGLECSGVYQQSFTFWIVTLQPLGAYRSTIPHIKGDIHGFHMRYDSLLLTKWLHRYGYCNSLSWPPLVKVVFSNLILSKWIRVQPTPVKRVLSLIKEGGPRVRFLVPNWQAGRRGADADGVQHRVPLVSVCINVSLWWTNNTSLKIFIFY